MSAAAEWIRADALRRQATAAERYAGLLWLTIEVAIGMGGFPPPGAEDRLEQACDTAERLTLEWQAAL